MRALLLLASLIAAPAGAGEGWPNIDEPVKTGANAPNDAAVVIGVEQYPFLTDVPYATRDASAFYDFLVYTRGVPSDRVQALYGASAEAMREAVREAAGEVGRGGVLWVYYAGHGGGDPDSGERLLVGDTAKPSDGEFAAGAISISEIRQLASGGRGEVVLVVDACYNGLGRDGGQYSDTRFAVPIYQVEQVARITEWTAAGPKELASPLREVQHGAFTYFVLGALRGWADGEFDGRRDGMVSPEEARLYVEKALRTVGRRDQHPQMVASTGLTLLSSGGEAAPDLRDLSAGGASAAQATSGELMSSGGFVVDLDVSAALAEKACTEDAGRKASSQRSSRVSSEAESLAREASSAWSKLDSQASACLGLEMDERSPCIAAFKEYIRWAESLEVVLTEGFEQVSTECGERSVPMAAQRRSVSVSELEAAKAALARLEKEPSLPPEEVVPMVELTEGASLPVTTGQERHPAELPAPARSISPRVVAWVADGLLLVGGGAALAVGWQMEQQLGSEWNSLDAGEQDQRVRQTNIVYGLGYSGLGIGGLGAGAMLVFPATTDAQGITFRWTW